MSHKLNQALCDALGIDANQITSFNLRVRAGKLPTLTLQRHVLEPIQPIAERFNLVPTDGTHCAKCQTPNSCGGDGEYEEALFNATHLCPANPAPGGIPV